jgi:hypothetical protein
MRGAYIHYCCKQISHDSKTLDLSGLDIGASGVNRRFQNHCTFYGTKIIYTIFKYLLT